MVAPPGRDGKAGAALPIQSLDPWDELVNNSGRCSAVTSRELGIRGLVPRLCTNLLATIRYLRTKDSSGSLQKPRSCFGWNWKRSMGLVYSDLRPRH